MGRAGADRPIRCGLLLADIALERRPSQCRSRRRGNSADASEDAFTRPRKREAASLPIETDQRVSCYPVMEQDAGMESPPAVALAVFDSKAMTN